MNFHCLNKNPKPPGHQPVMALKDCRLLVEDFCSAGKDSLWFFLCVFSLSSVFSLCWRRFSLCWCRVHRPPAEGADLYLQPWLKRTFWMELWENAKYRSIFSKRGLSCHSFTAPNYHDISILPELGQLFKGLHCHFELCSGSGIQLTGTVPPRKLQCIPRSLRDTEFKKKNHRTPEYHCWGIQAHSSVYPLDTKTIAKCSRCIMLKVFTSLPIVSVLWVWMQLLHFSP